MDKMLTVDDFTKVQHHAESMRLLLKTLNKHIEALRKLGVDVGIYSRVDPNEYARGNYALDVAAAIHFPVLDTRPAGFEARDYQPKNLEDLPEGRATAIGPAYRRFEVG